MLVLVFALAQAPAARADGDPASDVLAGQSLFLPADGGFSRAEQAGLTELLTSAQRSGYPIRVALVATPSDLGSVSSLWGAPAAYARFLGDELSLVYRGTLLVVMPAGFGVDVVGSGPAGAAAGARAAAALGAPPRGTPMVAAALTAIEKLAARAGHRLATPSPTVPASGSGSALGSVDLASWVALVAGAAAIAAAWAASLRARPARLRRAR
ncbi:MAG TPA: hypothetical protein VG325_03770 [Solirubrobacteraceae bacterium]|jgi:hypothetical protein|nr:hypothetical protein [Solirubrobacteraceae bacterium]